jgi:hypothetical protein
MALTGGAVDSVADRELPGPGLLGRESHSDWSGSLATKSSPSRYVLTEQ